jgi:hypothetical protein
MKAELRTARRLVISPVTLLKPSGIRISVCRIPDCANSRFGEY